MVLAAMNTTAHSEVKKPAGGLRPRAGLLCALGRSPRAMVVRVRKSGPATPRTEPHSPLPGTLPAETCARELPAWEVTQKGKEGRPAKGEQARWERLAPLPHRLDA